MKNKFLLLFLSSAFLIFANTIFASDILIVPNSTKANIGNTITATVFIDTKGKSINNAEAIINFSKDIIEVVSVDKSGSIFNFWLEDPKFSNSVGKVSFNGGLPNPGYTGVRGNIVKINFRTKKSGQASISFLTANVRLNDGLGTDDTQGKIGATIDITGSSPVIEAPKEIQTQDAVLSLSNTPITSEVSDIAYSKIKGPEIRSDDAPDENNWYSTDKVTFTWDILKGVTGVQLLYGKKPDSIPSISYIPPINTKTIDELKDGTYYFHARFRDYYGWGETTHRKINIDKTPPFDLIVNSSADDLNLITIRMSARDELSGLSKFLINIEGQETKEVDAKNGEAVYVMSPLAEGEHKIIVSAKDFAGNTIKKDLNIQSKGIKTPVINQYPQNVKKGEKIKIAGSAYYSEVKVLVYANDILIGETTTDNKGDFIFESKPVEKDFLMTTSALIENTNIDDELILHVETFISDTVRSLPSEKVLLALEPAFRLNIDFARYFGSNVIIMLLFTITFILIILLYLDMRRMKTTKKILNRDLVQTEIEVRRILEVIQNEIRNSNKLLKKASGKRQQALSSANKEEYKILDQLSKNIEIAEKYFSEKMKNITDRD